MNPSSDAVPATPADPAGPTSPETKGSRFAWGARAAAVWWLMLFVWLGAQSDHWSRAYRFTGRETDYYNLLVDGFLKGHLYLDLAVDPACFSPDPAVQRRALHALDAALYGHHYYLYYGVTPAVCLLLPYTALTRQHMGLETACLIFWLIGFALSLIWLRRWHRDHGRACGPGFGFVAVSLLAIMPATVFLVRRAFFYELPIVAGYAFLALLFLALYETLHGRAPLRWLIIASASVGFAVGCRPNHLLLAPLVAWVAWRASRRAQPARLARIWSATVLPAAALGLLLAIYNYGRFGSPFDFGFSHGVNSFFDTPRSVFDPRFIGVNLVWYLFTPPSFSCYFPFVFPANAFVVPANYGNAEAIHGFLAGTLVMGWVALGFLFVRRRPRLPSALRAWSQLLLIGFVAELLCMCALAIRANRYTVDFLTPLAFVITAAAGSAWSGLERRRRRTWWRIGLALLAAVVALITTASAVQLFDKFRDTRPREFAAWSRLLNPPRRWFRALGFADPSRLVMTVRFRRLANAVIEPLVVTGLPIYNDGVYVAEYPNGYIQILMDHNGYGGTRTGLIHIAWDHDYRIEVLLGSLLPPASDPYFRGMDPRKVAIWKTTALVKFDSRTVIDHRMAFYDSPPWAVYLGRDPVRVSGKRPRFSGEIVSWHHAPADLAALTAQQASAGLYRFEMSLFPHLPPGGEPVLAAGLTGRGTLLLLDHLPDGRFRMAIDEWGHGLIAGAPFALAADRPHLLEIVVGPQAARQDWPAGWKQAPSSVLEHALLVWLDHRLVARFELNDNLDLFGNPEIGSNSAGFSTAQSNFAGELRRQTLDEAQKRDLIARAASVLKP